MNSIMEIFRNIFKKYPSQLIAVACIITNHIYMHYCVLDGDSINTLWLYRALTFVFFDILTVLLLFGAITLFLHKKAAYTATWLFWLVVDIANIGYSRFFHQYLSVGALAEAKNLDGMWWTEFIVPALRLPDVLLVFTSAIFLMTVLKPQWLCFMKSNAIEGMKGRMEWKKLLCLLILVVLPHTFISDAYNIYQGERSESISDYISSTQGDDFHKRVILEQKMYFCAYGLLRTAFFFSVFYPNTHKVLTQEEKAEITSFLKEKSALVKPIYPDAFSLHEKYNVSMIIVESYLACVSDMKVNNREVTPVLNALKHLEGTYYNGNMEDNSALGESSDAQLVYFTGLFPEQNGISVTSLSQKTMVSLPALLKQQKGFYTYMTIPTKKHMWHQDEVNVVYGIDSLASSLSDTDARLSNDEELVEKAIQCEQTMREPFLHVILTASMHSPYDKRKDFLKDCPLEFPKDLSTEYCNYLRACWFTDKALGKYIEVLKERGIYEKTVIVILADHKSHPELLNMSPEQLDNCRLPFYIINANIPTGEGERSLQQVDVFPTLIDLLGIEHEWRGMGNSIFRPMPKVSADYMTRRANASELILTGNWFAENE